MVEFFDAEEVKQDDRLQPAREFIVYSSERKEKVIRLIVFSAIGLLVLARMVIH